MSLKSALALFLVVALLSVGCVSARGSNLGHFGNGLQYGAGTASTINNNQFGSWGFWGGMIDTFVPFPAAPWGLPINTQSMYPNYRPSMYNNGGRA